MREEIIISIPLAEFEKLQKDWIKQVLKEIILPQKEEEELLTRKQVAEILGISLVTLNQYTKDGILPCYYLGSRVRYKRNEVFESLKRFKKYERRGNE